MTTPTSSTVDTRSLPSNQALRFIMVALGGALLTALAAQVRIPLPWTPVPVTLQTLAVLAIAAHGGRFAGSAAVVSSQLTYLAFGIAGVPVFALASGATLGYALAFPIAAFLASIAAQSPRLSFASRTLVMSAGLFLVLVLGSLWLKVSLGLSASEVIAFGTTPFLGVEVAKATMVAASVRR